MQLLKELHFSSNRFNSAWQSFAAKPTWWDSPGCGVLSWDRGLGRDLASHGHRDQPALRLSHALEKGRLELGAGHGGFAGGAAQGGSGGCGDSGQAMWEGGRQGKRVRSLCNTQS